MAASPLPLSSLRLLVPPLRLLTAAMWQVARHQNIKHYGMLEDFVCMVTEAVPQLLTDRQRSLLLLALRAKVTLSIPDAPAVPAHMDEIRSFAKVTADEVVEECCSTLLSLSTTMIKSPGEASRLLKVFDHSFDAALQSLLSDLLSRIEQLFPIPNFKQAACWLDAALAGVEDCPLEAHRAELQQLLTNQSSSLGQVFTSVGGDSEKTLLSVLSHPLFSRLTNPEPPDLPDAQSDAPLDAELVKVEAVRVKDGLTEAEASNNSSAEGSEEYLPAVEGVDRRGDSPGDRIDQSEDTVDQLDRPEVTANPLFSISHNSQRVAHKCPRCAKCFIYRSQVIRHLRTNRTCCPPTAIQDRRPLEPRPIRAHSCFQCSEVFRTKAELLSHQRVHRTRPSYRCTHCDKEFHHQSSLTNHKQTHLDKAGFTCRRCYKVFESAKDRDAHRAQHRPPNLTCTVCSQTFGSQTQLLRHLQTHSVEGAEPRYTCRYCELSFSGVTQLRIHQRTHTFRSYQCDQCSKTYGSLTGLQSHRASHSADSRFLCSQCGKRFKTRDGLEGHLRTHTGERPYRCPYCPKDFTALAGLNVHVRRHTGERPYVCSVCGKGWPSGGDLQKHMRTHTGERPYVCQECGKAFSISCHLTEHRRIHTGEKPFSCPDCGKCLRRKFDLKKHMLSHSNVRPHGCSFCSKSYTRKTHLNRHLLTHSSVHSQDAAEAQAET
ncbi:unnamed protein product [Ophioblennius macclurei]